MLHIYSQEETQLNISFEMQYELIDESRESIRYS